jgi:hypothetical protein
MESESLAENDSSSLCLPLAADGPQGRATLRLYTRFDLLAFLLFIFAIALEI